MFLDGVFTALQNDSDVNVVLGLDETHDAIIISASEPFKLIDHVKTIHIQASAARPSVTRNANGGFTFSGNCSVSCVNGVTYVNGVRCSGMDEYYEMEQKRPKPSDPDCHDKWLLSAKTRFHNIVTSKSGDVTIGSVPVDPNMNLRIDGSGNIDMTNQHLKTLHVVTRGSGDVRLDDVQVSQLLSVTVRGSSTFHLDGEGKCDIIEIASTGSGDVSVSNLQVATISILSQGSSHTQVVTPSGWITEKADVSTKGSGDINLEITILEAKLSTQGSGNISRFTALKTLEASTSGSGDINGKSREGCRITRREQGSGKVRLKTIKISMSDAPPPYEE